MKTKRFLFFICLLSAFHPSFIRVLFVLQSLIFWHFNFGDKLLLAKTIFFTYSQMVPAKNGKDFVTPAHTKKGNLSAPSSFNYINKIYFTVSTTALKASG